MTKSHSEVPLVRVSVEGNSIQKETIVEEVAVRLHALKKKNVYDEHSILLATPTDLVELHAGHLYSEGYIEVIPCKTEFQILDDSTPTVQYKGMINTPTRERIVTSSCGACNHPDLTIHRDKIEKNPIFSNLSISILGQALDELTNAMPLFQQSGGCHGVALYFEDGTIDFVSEDIGRHNAVDKTIGKAILSGKTTLTDTMLLLSGRCGWDIVAKCVRTGISAIASLGAFSSAAVNLAREHNVTLYGFVGDRGAWKVGYSADSPPSIDESD